MKIKFKSFGPLRRVLDNKVVDIEVSDDATVRDVVNKVVTTWGEAAKRLVMDGDRISGNLIIMLNMTDVDTLSGENTSVHSGDEVAILPHVQGG
ncbi:MAG: ubiquitin-like small modifier protein 1 [Candidatus Thorarchaeota archaeon]